MPAGQQHRRAGRLPGLEVHVCTRHFPQGVALVHMDGDDLAGDEVEELARSGEEIVALRRVRVQRRPGHVERAAGREPLEVERRDRPARGAEEHHQPEGREALQRQVEGVLADRVVDHRQLRPAGELLHLRQELAAVVVADDHWERAARRGRGLRLRLAPHGADDGHAEVLEPLAEDQAHPSGRGVDQDRLPALHLERPADEVPGREALEERGGGLLVGDALGDRRQALRGVVPRRGVRAQRHAGVRHPVAHLRRRHPGTDGGHHTCRLLADPAGELERVVPVALVHVDEVQPDRAVLDRDLARTGRRHLDLLQDHHLRASLLLQPHRQWHRTRLPGPRSRGSSVPAADGHPRGHRSRGSSPRGQLVYSPPPPCVASVCPSSWLPCSPSGPRSPTSPHPAPSSDTS
jgi:hypothetical protein